MAVCHYFLRGDCRFGSRCWYEHPRGSNGSRSSSSIHRQNIKEDMNLWEASKMWPFSCFSHEVGAQCLSGFLDYSPEELRLEAYKARESRTLDEYWTSVKQLNDQYKNRRAKLKSLTDSSWESEKQRL